MRHRSVRVWRRSLVKKTLQTPRQALAPDEVSYVFAAPTFGVAENVRVRPKAPRDGDRWAIDPPHRRSDSNRRSSWHVLLFET